MDDRNEQAANHAPPQLFRKLFLASLRIIRRVTVMTSQKSLSIRS